MVIPPDCTLKYGIIVVLGVIFSKTFIDLLIVDLSTLLNFQRSYTSCS